MKKTFIIGDVHGCYYALLDLLKKIPNDAKIIFLGDLCDRGPFSKQVIELVIKNKYEVILGNHEDFMIKGVENYINSKSHRWFTDNYIGGKEAIESYKNDDGKIDTKLLKEHANFFKTLPRYKLIDKFFITHGLGLPYYKRRDSKDLDIQDGIIKARPSDEKTKWGGNLGKKLERI